MPIPTPIPSGTRNSRNAEQKKDIYELVVKALYFVLENASDDTKKQVINTIMSASQETLMQ